MARHSSKDAIKLAQASEVRRVIVDTFTALHREQLRASVMLEYLRGAVSADFSRERGTLLFRFDDPDIAAWCFEVLGERP